MVPPMDNSLDLLRRDTELFLVWHAAVTRRPDRLPRRWTFSQELWAELCSEWSSRYVAEPEVWSGAATRSQLAARTSRHSHTQATVSMIPPLDDCTL